MPIVATIQIMDEPEFALTNRADRRDVASVSTIRLPGRQVRDVTVHDLSTTGCRLTGARMSVGTVFRLGLAGGGTAEGIVVRDGADGYGCAFSPVISDAIFAQSFGAAPVVHALFAPSVGDGRFDEPAIERWPLPVRAATLIGAAAAAWAACVALYILA